MKILPGLRSLVHSLRRRATFEKNMVDELDHHLEQHTQDLIRSGLSPQEARRVARLKFGGTEKIREECRQAKGLALWDEFSRQMRFGFRTCRRNPLLTATAILTLGICVGANAAVFSVVDTIFWRPLPYPEPNRLARVTERIQDGAQPFERSAHDGRNWELIRDHASMLDSAVYSEWTKRINLSTEDRAAAVIQQRVGSGYFRVLGVPPLVGREFTLEEDRPGGAAVAILGYEIWNRLFERDLNIVGSDILLKGGPHTVVGVMPESFRSNVVAEVWTPLRPALTGEGEGANYSIVGRLKEGISWVQANQQVGQLKEALQTESGRQSGNILMLRSLQEVAGESMRSGLFAMFAAAGMLLLVGCANLAGVLLARAAARRTEIATRMALGGGAGVVVRQLLAEGFVTALLGGAAGLTLSYFIIHTLNEMARTQFEFGLSLQLDWRVVFFVATLILLATVNFGLLPALQVRKTDISSTLAAGGRGGRRGSGHWGRRLLVLGEIGLVVTLLFGAVLVVRSYLYLNHLEPGFDAANVVTAQISLDDVRYGEAERVRFLVDETIRRLGVTPGIQGAAVSLTLPYERALNLGFLHVEGETERGSLTNLSCVTPDFFSLLRIPVVAGRGFEATDSQDAPPVAVVNRSFVKRYLAGYFAVGQHLAVSGEARRIVGVVGNVQQARAGWGAPEPIWQTPMVYLPVSQAGGGFLRAVHLWFSPSWLVKTTGPGVGTETVVRNVFRDVDPQLPVSRFRSLEGLMADALCTQSLQASVLSGVAGLAMLLASIGVYGLVSNSVIERRTEMSIRLALGASPGQAITTLAVSTLKLIFAGMVAGVGLSVLSIPLLQQLIWGVEPFDLMTFAIVAGGTLVVAVAAMTVPAVRVTRLRPERVLRAT